MARETSRILIVDDSPEDREHYRRMLSQDPEHQYQFLEAEMGEEGLGLALAGEADCLLLDYRLPDVDGLEFLTRLRERRRVPVIVLTGQGNEAVAVEAMKGGAQDYLLKGAVTRQALQSAVRNAIERVALQREVEERTAELARANEALQKMYSEQETLVRQRTAELSRANEELKKEVVVRQELRRQAEEANRMKDEFLATLSHELRTPLNAMLGWAQVLRLGKLDPEASARALETIERNARSQAQLIADLLDVSRIITGKLRLDLQPVELPRIIEAALESVRPGADAKGVDLDVFLDRLTSPVMGDADRLQQVVWNLLSNAIKFTSPGGKVTVRLREAQGSAEIQVEDTGAGIRPDFLPYVFDRFRQAESTITRSHGGLGLGLSIVRHLVELHGGAVSVDSDGDGKGAAFTVRLPVRQAMAGNAESLDETLDGKARVWSTQGLLAGVRVLVVEDEDDTRELLVIALEQCGAQVTAVATTADALASLDRVPPDVLVSDLAMPDEDGFALIRQVRSRKAGEGGDVPAAALTAYARTEDRIRALASGFQRHLPKPLDPSDLIAAVAALAGRG
ncbi:MAG TPA: response regulator [Thermoanaerobaculia bacterium]|nr:response regulator [Thermoanaerobaculia bacterium]